MFFSRKRILQKLPRGTDALFFADWSLMWKFIVKELRGRFPLNYWWKGLSARWSCFFNNCWFDKIWKRRLAGRRNSVEHWNVSGIGFHVKGFVYDNHMPATFLLNASCRDQIREQFLTCRFQVTISISTKLFFDTVHLMKNLKLQIFTQASASKMLLKL